ncbi:type II toxin-antitoxin system RelE/ParE family toxin [Belliella sp. DSM 107340]|uniref:Type II toxin-antitoxin system RelE/ParE family toxin n=1 Tax=Belliella calami TaxID=2923436 RepID=A0ABS9UT75_9BACT|nr:type II toxin-antitoxin system RelE/ParE family toxin [Belliella calami]
MYKATILPLAKKDIQEAALWYNSRSNGLGKRFTDEVREKVKLIKKNPYATNVRYHKVRTAVLNFFPFIIHYSIDEANKNIVISAVFHTSRNPELWKNR